MDKEFSELDALLLEIPKNIQQAIKGVVDEDNEEQHYKQPVENFICNCVKDDLLDKMANDSENPLNWQIQTTGWNLEKRYLYIFCIYVAWKKAKRGVDGFDFVHRGGEWLVRRDGVIIGKGI